MALALVAVNLVAAVAVAAVVVRWQRARAATPPLDPAGSVTIRVQARPPDPEQVERLVDRALGAAAFVPAGGGRWADRGGAQARTAPPVVGDRASLVEVATGRADAVVAELVGALLGDGYAVKAEKGRRVVLRRGPDRVDLRVGPA